jgi:hypothetical protein
MAEYHESLDQFEAAEYVPGGTNSLIYQKSVLTNAGASFFFNEAYRAYTSQPHYKPELARHYFIQGQALDGRGDGEAAKRALGKAQALYNELVPQTELVTLSLELLNGIVAPWVW